MPRNSPTVSTRRGAAGQPHYRKFEDPLGYDRVALNQYHAFASPTGGFMILKGRYKYRYYLVYLPEFFDLNGDRKASNHRMIHDPRRRFATLIGASPPPRSERNGRRR